MPVRFLPSGRRDLNPRPVAAATVLQIQHGKFVAASPRLEIALSSHGFGPSRETFLFHEKPWDSVARGPWNDLHYADVSDRQGPDMNQHSIGPFSCSEGHKHETCLSGF